MCTFLCCFGVIINDDDDDDVCVCSVLVGERPGPVPGVILSLVFQLGDWRL